MMTTESNCGRCGQTTHNSPSCNNGEVYSFKLFGVTIDPKRHGKEKEVEDNRYQYRTHNLVDYIGNSIRKSTGINGLEACNTGLNIMDLLGILSEESRDRYRSRSHKTEDKKRGVSTWSEDEHRSFLLGLEKLGKGNWTGISKSYVPSRTPTQVASHAQKYFMRMKAMRDKGTHRSSQFDMLTPFNESLTAPKTRHATFDRPGMAQNYDFRDFYCMSYKMSYPISSRNEHISSDRRRHCSPCVPMTSYSNLDHAYPLDSCRWTKRVAARQRFMSPPLAITRVKTLMGSQVEN